MSLQAMAQMKRALSKFLQSNKNNWHHKMQKEPRQDEKGPNDVLETTFVS